MVRDHRRRPARTAVLARRPGGAATRRSSVSPARVGGGRGALERSLRNPSSCRAGAVGGGDVPPRPDPGRRHRGRRWATAFTVLPWHLLKAEGHPTLVHLEGLPLLLVAAVFWFRSPSGWRVLLLPLATGLLWLTSVSLGVVGTVAALVLAAAAAPAAPIAVRAWGARCWAVAALAGRRRGDVHPARSAGRRPGRLPQPPWRAAVGVRGTGQRGTPSSATRRRPGSRQTGTTQRSPRRRFTSAGSRSSSRQSFSPRPCSAAPARRRSAAFSRLVRAACVVVASACSLPSPFSARGADARSARCGGGRAGVRAAAVLAFVLVATALIVAAASASTPCAERRTRPSAGGCPAAWSDSRCAWRSLASAISSSRRRARGRRALPGRRTALGRHGRRSAARYQADRSDDRGHAPDRQPHLEEVGDPYTRLTLPVK